MWRYTWWEIWEGCGHYHRVIRVFPEPSFIASQICLLHTAKESCLRRAEANVTFLGCQICGLLFVSNGCEDKLDLYYFSQLSHNYGFSFTIFNCLYDLA
ncbi:unnamed protein product [Chondrus crispus]|uniref:Uncharacterized protein n=1 Tax=Chondrus crispus TaxID=2769 RepID=R7QPG7_CHOCR|nr:unnamed protein product [Chondrus crispus]CDF39668.1 unnamed protein product [Chondrus crispus]|eukprot:XP_005709962.1 unnamed protein product [Chondrus crispus]